MQGSEKEVVEANDEVRRLKQQLKEAQDDIARLTKEVENANTELNRHQKLAEERKFCFSNIEKSDKDVQFYTGLQSASVFYKMLEFVSPGRKRSNIVYRATAQQWVNDEESSQSEPGQASWRQYEVNAGHPASLSQAHELFLTLVWLRLNLKEQDLANRFKISMSSVSRIFATWINFCYLHLGLLPCWPDHATISETMPATFKELYPRTTAIIDATEIKVNTPSSLLLQSQIYSNYKSTNTFKALIAISPAGHVVFVSSVITIH